MNKMKPLYSTAKAICLDGSEHSLEVPELYTKGIRISDIGNLRNVDHIQITINRPGIQLRAETLSKMALADVPLRVLTYD